jgi:Zn-dependent peptidase ImmA (M78 family)
MNTELNINVDMISWAITRAGYELHDFALIFPKVQAWLENTKKPTLKQLESFSNKVHLPFGYLFLQEPPLENLPIPFFRTGSNKPANVSLNVYDTILLIQRRQEWLVDYLTDHDFEKLSFVGRYKSKNNYRDIVADIRQTLQLESEWASQFRTWEEALDHLTQKIEDARIIVNFNGIVANNTHRPIKVDECRGFVLVDKMAPFMFINAADGKAAQLFTIVHELAHIWTGHSAGFDFRQLQPANNPNEQLCDKVAAEFLVPEDSFNRIWSEHPDIKVVARYFKVSPIVVARRALDLGKISRTDFFAFYNEYNDQVQYKKNNQSDGGDFFATAKKRISLQFAAHINRAVKENKLLYRDACKLTGLKGDTYQNFISKFL